MLRAITIGVVVLAATWIAMAMAVWQATALAAGWDVAERLVPYANAHLLELAAEGLYQPWRDPVFWMGVVANTMVPIVIATFISARLHVAAPFAVAAVALLTLVFSSRQVFSSGFPGSVRAGVVIEICAAGLACAVTVAVFRTMRPSRTDAL